MAARICELLRPHSPTEAASPATCGVGSGGSAQGCITAVEVGGVDVGTRSGYIHPASVVGEVRQAVIGIGGSDSNGLRVISRIVGSGAAAVSCSGNDDSSAVPSLLNGALQGRASGSATQAQADDICPVLGGISDSVGNGCHGSASAVIQHANRHDGGVGSHSCNSRSVIGHGSGNSCAVGSMSVPVLGIAVVINKVVPLDDFSLQIRMIRLTPVSSDGDHRAAAAAGDIPSFREARTFLRSPISRLVRSFGVHMM